MKNPKPLHENAGHLTVAAAALGAVSLESGAAHPMAEAVAYAQKVNDIGGVAVGETAELAGTKQPDTDVVSLGVL